MPEDAVRQTIVDEEHLKLLSLGYMVSAGVNALFALFGLFYLLMGAAMVVGFSHVSPNPGHPNEAPPAFIGWIFGGLGAAFFIVAMTVALLKVRASRCIKRRKSRTFCMVMAGISCIEFPYGTLLGVLAFMVLGRASIEALFAPMPTSAAME